MQLLDTVWQRRGTSWVWHEKVGNQVCANGEAWSLCQFVQAAGHWPDGLPSNDTNTPVVAGLEGCLDLLTPEAVARSLGEAVKNVGLSFHSYYEKAAPLIFRLPSSLGWLKVHRATEPVEWRCATPHSAHLLAVGRWTWRSQGDYPTLTQGGLSMLEVLSPFVELTS